MGQGVLSADRISLQLGLPPGRASALFGFLEVKLLIVRDRFGSYSVSDLGWRTLESASPSQGASSGYNDR